MGMKMLTNKQGSASVIVIMVMLLLVVFGILAFVSGGSSLKLAEKNAHTVRAYYLLDKKAEIAVGQIATLLKSEAGSAGVSELQKATGIQDVTMTAQGSGNPVYTVIVKDEGLENSPSLRIQLQASGGGVKISEWKLMYKPFDYNETVELWDGGN